MRVCLVILLLFLGNACGLFADMAGYEDRIARHVGPPTEVLEAHGGDYFVRTDANVVARLSAESGEIKWRYAAVRGEKHDLNEA